MPRPTQEQKAKRENLKQHVLRLKEKLPSHLKTNFIEAFLWDFPNYDNPEGRSQVRATFNKSCQTAHETIVQDFETFVQHSCQRLSA